jgi:hypothetical protein
MIMLMVIRTSDMGQHVFSGKYTPGVLEVEYSLSDLQDCGEI